MTVRKVRLEASAICQLKCPLCPTGQRQPGIGWGFLRLRDFEVLLDNSPGIRNVELSNWGEIFLNPELLSIMEYAYRRGVRLYADNGVNFNRCDEAVLEGLVKYRFASLRVALDGSSAESYERYRLGGKFDTVIGNVKKLNEYKAAYNSELPKLTWQFIVFGHNEHELPAARAMAQDLGMEFEARLSWDSGWSPVKDSAFIRRELGVYAASREEYRARFEKGYMRPCHDLWQQPAINWDGRLLGCCVNFSFGDFGNVFSSGLSELMEGENYQYAQGMVTGELPERPDIPCARCHIYRQMKADDSFIKQPPREDASDGPSHL